MDRLLNENRRRPQDPGGGAEAVPPAPAPPADRRDRRRPDGVCPARWRRRCVVEEGAGHRLRRSSCPDSCAGLSALGCAGRRALASGPAVMRVRHRTGAQSKNHGSRAAQCGRPGVRTFDRDAGLEIGGPHGPASPLSTAGGKSGYRALRRLVGRGSSMWCLYKQHPGTVAATTTASSGSSVSCLRCR
jgi:hypothetical protein